jgi:beta-N-acetylhexosaminidase
LGNRQRNFMIALDLRVFCLFINMVFACAPAGERSTVETPRFQLKDYYNNDPRLDLEVNSVFQSLTDKERIAQMIITSAGKNGKPTAKIRQLIAEKAIGGIVLLGGEKSALFELTQTFDSLAEMSGLLPLIYSADAEPSLFNQRIGGAPQVAKTAAIRTIEHCDLAARTIANTLLDINVRHNYAPVLDLSQNNIAITHRTFGNDSAHVVPLASAFARTMQDQNIAATAKHFPGHGLVSGDTHYDLATIDGLLAEVPNYQALIEGGVVSVMVGHIAVINNELYDTGGLPSTCSRVIVTDLLKKRMGFQGLVISDAMNMGALKSIKKPSLRAVRAGCDMILMEPNERQLLEDIHDLYQLDLEFREQVDISVKKILRLKLCVNVVNTM